MYAHPQAHLTEAPKKGQVHPKRDESERSSSLPLAKPKIVGVAPVLCNPAGPSATTRVAMRSPHLLGQGLENTNLTRGLSSLPLRKVPQHPSLFATLAGGPSGSVNFVIRALP